MFVLLQVTLSISHDGRVRERDAADGQQAADDDVAATEPVPRRLGHPLRRDDTGALCEQQAGHRRHGNGHGHVSHDVRLRPGLRAGLHPGAGRR